MPTDFVPTLPQLQAYSDKATPGLSFANGDTADVFFHPEGSSFAGEHSLVARCATGPMWNRNAAFIAACVNYVRKVVLPDFQSGAIARRKPAILFDIEAARANDWPWYVVDSLDDDGKHDDRAVERNGEWRIYFETASHILADLDIDEPANLRDVLTNGFDERADELERQMARAEVDGGHPTIEIEENAIISRADQHTWVAAWIQIDTLEPEEVS